MHSSSPLCRSMQHSSDPALGCTASVKATSLALDPKLEIRRECDDDFVSVLNATCLASMLVWCVVRGWRCGVCLW